MNSISPTYYNLVRYFLLGDTIGRKKISEPIGWKEDEKEFKRSPKVHGVFINLSNNLEFYKGDEKNNGGYDYLVASYEAEGINANVILIKQEQVNNEWVESYRGHLDFSTYSKLNNKAKIRFNESGLYEKIKARQSEKIELGRLDTMDGDAIEPLETETVALDGREILILSKLQRTKTPESNTQKAGQNFVINQETHSQLSFAHNSLGDFEAIAVPISMISEISGDVQTVYDYDIPENESSYGDGKGTGNMFYAIADDDIPLTIDFNVSFMFSGSYVSDEIRLDIVKYENGLNYDFKEYINLKTVTNPVADLVYSFVSTDEEIELLIGESLALVFHSTRQSNSRVGMQVFDADVTIKDFTFFDKSTAKFVLPKEGLERILHIITGVENTLKSNILGRTDLGDAVDGDASLTGLTNGFWVRKFDDEELTTSFKDFIGAFETIWQIGYGIEKLGFTEQVRVEKLTHFYNDNVTIVLGTPKNIKRTVAKEYFYSGIEIGYEKPSGDNLYEESMGLDEYNIRNSYTTIISRVENAFNKLSKYRADSYGKEFARRKPITNFPEEDTRYDKEVMVMDLKRNSEGGTNFEERKWADDFEIPLNFPNFDVTGVFSADTATNLRFSPLNTLLRWGFWIKGGLDKYLTSYIRYGSTEGNSSLKTQLIGGDTEYAENGNVLVSDLDKNIFIPEYVEFEFPVDSELLRTVNSSTVFDGETIMNYYGLVEFINEDNKYEYGYLMNLKPNGKGSWKLLRANKKAYRRAVQKGGDNTITVPSNLEIVDIN
jgi:hypothetical protein